MNTAHAEAGDAPIEQLKGIGPRLAQVLAPLGLVRLQDLWFHLPLRYEDRTQLTAIARLQPGQRAQVEGTVDACERGFRFRPQLRVALTDTSHATLILRFFHFRASQVAQFEPGARVRCYGEVRLGQGGALEMVHPSYQRVSEGAPLAATLTPIYPVTEGISPARMAQLVALALRQLPDDAQLECIPADWRRRLGLGSLREALRLVHHPAPDSDIAALIAGTHPAQSRLAFEELLAHQLSLRRLRARIRARPGPLVSTAGVRRAQLMRALPYTLTGAQQRVLVDIDRDLARGEPMLRLLQGDVGAGKTVVAASAALSVIDAGWQAAMMAPTEVLAEQHARTLRSWLEPLGVRIGWLSGRLTGKARERALAALAGEAELIVGTHALMQDGVTFRRLGLAIIDEQHRFGVHQRLALRDKGAHADAIAHQLVMTATPIPRTLAMTAYADLDVSILDEMPPGRQPVQTVALAATRRDEVIERIRAACAQGRQAYWVCTLIEESDQLEAQAAQAAYDSLRDALPGIAVGLVHGRLKAKDKQAAMAAFAGGQTQLLVATTVIEVGVDVPNASLMVIENAERLGLSQLHQLRGRVGRGAQASSCVLLYQPPLSDMARARLNVMRETNDGFLIAEKDLALRGPGELLGTRQTGAAAFRVADLTRDGASLPQVAALAQHLLAQAPTAVDRLIRRWIGAAVRFAEA